MSDPRALAAVALTGLAAGFVNALAGGGSLLSFPALIALGLPPLVANVTNTVAMVPGYLGGALGQRQQLRGQGEPLQRIGLQRRHPALHQAAAPKAAAK